MITATTLPALSPPNTPYYKDCFKYSSARRPLKGVPTPHSAPGPGVLYAVSVTYRAISHPPSTCSAGPQHLEMNRSITLHLILCICNTEVRTVRSAV